jgi:hypothetical protein
MFCFLVRFYNFRFRSSCFGFVLLFSRPVSSHRSKVHALELTEFAPSTYRHLSIASEVLFPTGKARHQAWGLSFPTLIRNLGLRHYVRRLQESLLGDMSDGILISTDSSLFFLN